jgi:L-xylulokinase
MDLLLGIDIGSTTIKSVVFDSFGREISSAKRVVPITNQNGGISERNLNVLWEKTIEAIKESLGESVDLASTIAAVGLSGAGDGLVILNGKGNPVCDAITSLDTRASEIVKDWLTVGVAQKMAPIIGESPFSGTPVALLRWMKINEPENYNKAKHIMFFKDWIKYKLTGVMCTDPTDASATLTDLQGHYQETIFQSFQIEESFEKGVPIVPSETIIGYVDKQASDLTGLRQGTPVTSGVHDCSAAALGSGCLAMGQTCIITGTWCGNLVISSKPIVDEQDDKFWVVRNFVLPDSWLLVSSSPASGVNLAWFEKEFETVILNGTTSGLAYEACDELVKQTNSKELLFYHPFLYGSKLETQASASFFGIRPWHTIADFVRALFEGIAFNHCIHLKELQRAITLQEIRISGGGSKSDIWMQIFADVINSPIEVPISREVSALGAAIVAAKGIGAYPDYKAACAAMTGFTRSFKPVASNVAILSEKRAIYELAYRQMLPVWDMIQSHVSSNCNQ